MIRFKKGDSVICSDYGIGYVISNSGVPLYPIVVEFQSDNSVVAYTIDGRSVIGQEITLKHHTHNWKA